VGTLTRGADYADFASLVEFGFPQVPIEFRRGWRRPRGPSQADKLCGLAGLTALAAVGLTRACWSDDFFREGRFSWIVRECAVEQKMSRVARESSWHLLALVLVVAGLAALAPVAWWQAQRPLRPARMRHAAAARPHGERPLRRASSPHKSPTSLEPQVAPLRPLVADQIDLDPSIHQTPALPAGPSPRANQELLGHPSGDLRLSPQTLASRQPLDLKPRATDLPLREPLSLALETDLQADEEVFPVTKAWPYPSGLVEQLNILSATNPAAAPWADQVKAEIDRLVLAESLADPRVPSVLTTLHQLAQAGKQLAESQPDVESRSSVLRAGFAIVRRLVIWDQVHALSAQPLLFTAAPVVDHQAWNRAMGEVDALLQASGAAANWRKYLLIDRARQQIDSRSTSLAEQRDLARQMLHRLESTQLSHAQQEFLKTPALVALTSELRARSVETPNFVALLGAIERYEHIDSTSHARRLALEYDALRWNSDPGIKELAETVNAYYRNANVRVALSSELINRLLPRAQSQFEPVQDMILGARVEGQSLTNTKLRLVLLPDEHRWNVGLEALGEVASNTASSKGPATFYQDGWSRFRARKRLTVDRRGIRLFSSQAAADAQSQLNDFETDFDGIPFLCGIVRAIARNQYDTSQSAAKVEVESRIVGRATSQLDREVGQRLEQAKRDFQARMVEPLRRLEVEPTAVDLETTADRLIGRYRLAGRDQISAHTPRPQAPGDSLLSVQIHETAFNNILDKLNLAGREIELHDLFREMTSRFNLEQAEIPEDLPEDVLVTFADEDPVRIDAQDGRVRLTIRLKELAQGRRNRWTHFTVRGYYAPTADQLEANLEREGIIELIGDEGTIRLSDQIALRGIFARVLSRNRKLNLVNKQIAQSPELQDQQVTQFVIHDGWIGVALGPHAPGRQAHMQPKAELAGAEE
jgi:hypothetical protein